ncbi:helix-turn-helix domain-containing protein [Streptomyces sp. NPDC058374]|uniref:helix-turn-helix domain-containing protein n=2 Tax=Streptomyces TaxID=1883 RepID=UPI0036658480
MPRSNHDKPPLLYVADGRWPDVRLEGSAPLSAHCGLLLAQSLHKEMAARGLSLRSLAGAAGVAHSSIARVVTGHTLPDVGSLARLEDALERELWPGWRTLRSAVVAARPPA